MNDPKTNNPFKQESFGDDLPDQSRRTRSQRLILQSTAVLPALCTLLNGISGFAAIHFATRTAGSQNEFLFNFAVAGWLIFLSMLFDMLDGRLARLTRRTSDFGGQLDSLCDVISFGVAPAILMVRVVSSALGGEIERIESLSSSAVVIRTIWVIAAVYVSCAALRLARFNVENEPDESAHMHFRGLPTPGAAAAVAAVVLLLVHLPHVEKGWRSTPWVMVSVSVTLPVVTLLAGLLMVSRFKYPHLVNQYIRGRRPFSYLLKMVLIFLVAIVEPFFAIALGTIAYALWGPIAWLWCLRRRRG